MLFSLLDLMHKNHETDVFYVLEYMLINIFCYNAIYKNPLVYILVFICYGLKYEFKTAMKIMIGCWVFIAHCGVYLFTAVLLSQQSVVYGYMTPKHIVGVIMIGGFLMAFETLLILVYVFYQKKTRNVVEDFNQPIPPAPVIQNNS